MLRVFIVYETFIDAGINNGTLFFKLVCCNIYLIQNTVNGLILTAVLSSLKWGIVHAHKCLWSYGNIDFFACLQGDQHEWAGTHTIICVLKYSFYRVSHKLGYSLLIYNVIYKWK